MREDNEEGSGWQDAQLGGIDKVRAACQAGSHLQACTLNLVEHLHFATSWSLFFVLMNPFKMWRAGW